MHNQNSEHEVNSTPGDGIMNTRHHFSRRVMLGGLVGLVGAGAAGCSLPFGPAQATPTPTAIAQAQLALHHLLSHLHLLKHHLGQRSTPTGDTPIA